MGAPATMSAGLTETLALPDNMRPRVKFLTVVWGEAYIARFAGLALPSFIAPGNLPALAEATDLEVVIMTRRGDIAYFEQHKTFRLLQSVCPVRFVEIDDLITNGVYGVTLTLAYARPIIACGSEMLNTHFVFMNADFVLADGSLRSLCTQILAGRSIVLGPSFRATAEDVEPLLGAWKNEATGVLSIAPRELAGISMPHPHATTIAKIRDQHSFHSTHPNQFFWQIDQHTLLGRYYLIFMLCLKPERIIDSINSFCDYAFIPEMCPSGNEAVMGDSDDFFMLELQERAQEALMLRMGQQSEEKTIKSLRQWTTREHRRAAGYDIVFHTKDIPSTIGRYKKEAKSFIERLNNQLGPPTPHEGHRYWIRGREAWRNYRKALKAPGNPPELREIKFGLRTLGSWRLLRILFRQYFWYATYAAHGTLTGKRSRLSLLNPNYLDNEFLRKTLATAPSMRDGEMLVVRSDPASVDPLAPAGARIRFATIVEILGNKIDLEPDSPTRYTRILICLTRKESLRADQLIEKCKTAITRSSECHVVVHDPTGNINALVVATELMHLVDAVNNIPHCSADFFWIGGSLMRLNRRLIQNRQTDLSRFGAFALLWAFPRLIFEIPLLLATNFYLGSKLLTMRSTMHSSSMVIHLRPQDDKGRG